MARSSAVVIVLAGVVTAGSVAGCASGPDARTAAPQSLAASSRALADLPICDTVAAQECRLGEKIGGATLVVHPGATGTVQLDVIDDAGTDKQTLTEMAGAAPGTPRLEDLTADGRPTLVVPLDVGPVNTHYAVYRTDKAGRFVRAGEAGGTDFARTDSGYITITAGQGPADWSVAFFRMPDTQLLPVATVRVHLHPEAPGGIDCTVTDGGGPVRSGLTDPQTTAQFCAEPAVHAAATTPPRSDRGGKPAAATTTVSSTTTVSATPTTTATTTTTTTVAAQPTTTTPEPVHATTTPETTSAPETSATSADSAGADTADTASTTAADSSDTTDTQR
ncbi:hypothetical protein [Nocardia stercoris]|uniref:Uncharacterized protein n=1 Tax=Nocardia stercoris TaxID=2483361 RepID=A0A3M2KYX7_9NOCA|nr:hypothetical protein [Nocardia stercoris]RMI29473.1 hypothetical protein EBN03_25680 [Nocardia stercoris]